MVDVYVWSHCSNEWTHFATKNSVTEAEEMIKARKYDPKYVRIEKR